MAAAAQRLNDTQLSDSEARRSVMDKAIERRKPIADQLKA